MLQVHTSYVATITKDAHEPPMMLQATSYVATITKEKENNENTDRVY